MLMIKEISKEDLSYEAGKVGHMIAVSGDITEISMEFYLLARKIVKRLDDECDMGYLFKTFVEDLLPKMLNSDGDMETILSIVAKAAKAMEQDGGNDA